MRAPSFTTAWPLRVASATAVPAAAPATAPLTVELPSRPRMRPTSAPAAAPTPILAAVWVSLSRASASDSSSTITALSGSVRPSLVTDSSSTASTAGSFGPVLS